MTSQSSHGDDSLTESPTARLDNIAPPSDKGHYSKYTVTLVLLLSVTNIFILYKVITYRSESTVITNTPPIANDGFKAKNIAFGSCSSYDLRQMPIWEDAIIPSEPDVWIWAGDMVYLDGNEVNCEVTENSASIEWQQSCNCSATWLLSPPHTCHAGDAEYANQRWMAALNNGEQLLHWTLTTG